MKGIRFYQRAFSTFSPAHCRYYPTCSNYTLEAINRFGAVKGVLMGVARILRCQPQLRAARSVPAHFSLRRNPQYKEEDHRGKKR